MPYLKGSDICDISNIFGLPVKYEWGGGGKSRWKYLDDLLEHCIKNHRESDLLAYLFSKEQFFNKLNGYSSKVIETAYTQIVDTVINQINSTLNFGGNELVKDGNRFFIKKIDTSVKISAPEIKTIDRDYIASITERAMKNVNKGNCDSALTKSRTLLEEVFFYVIEKKGETPTGSGKIGQLYNQVKQLYNMHQDKDTDKRINMLLSGLEKIVSAIAEMRNKSGNSHGLGAKGINIDEHHARLFVNAAMTIADFILAVSEHSLQSKN